MCVCVYRGHPSLSPSPLSFGDLHSFCECHSPLYPDHNGVWGACLWSVSTKVFLGRPSACLSAPNAACLLRGGPPRVCGNQWPSLIFSDCRHHLALWSTPLLSFSFLSLLPGHLSFHFPHLFSWSLTWPNPGLIRSFCCGNMSASCLEKPRLEDFPLVRAHLRGLIKGFQSRIIPFHSGPIVLLALHTLTVPVESGLAGLQTAAAAVIPGSCEFNFRSCPAAQTAAVFGTRAEVTALDIDLLDLGCHLQKLLLGLFCMGIAVNFRRVSGTL